jgi:O-methyltransferase
MTTMRYAKSVRRSDHLLFDILRRVGLLGPLRRTYRQYNEYLRQRALTGKNAFLERALTNCHRRSIARLRALDPEGPLGDYLEFGVCYGSSMACMHDALKDTGEDGPRLYGFDSFEEMPRTAAGKAAAGSLSPLRATRDLLTRRDIDWSRTHLIKGWFDQTLTRRTARRHGIERAGMIMVDCVLHSSARRALAFCAPLIRDDAIVVFGNWNTPDPAEPEPGERKAFMEFMAEHPEFTSLELPSYHRDAAVFLVSRCGQPEG